MTKVNDEETDDNGEAPEMALAIDAYERRLRRRPRPHQLPWPEDRRLARAKSTLRILRAGLEEDSGPARDFVLDLIEAAAEKLFERGTPLDRYLWATAVLDDAVRQIRLMAPTVMMHFLGRPGYELDLLREYQDDRRLRADLTAQEWSAALTAWEKNHPWAALELVLGEDRKSLKAKVIFVPRSRRKKRRSPARSS